MPATLSDVARRVGVAPSTVADILRGRAGYAEATRRRTIEAARELDFVPNHFARSLLQQRSHTVGVAGRLGNASVTAPIFKAIVDTLSERGYMPLFCDTSSGAQGQERAIRELRARSVDGLILILAADLTALQQLPANVPCVPIQSITSDVPSVATDPAAALGRGVEWLAERGHQRIAFMGVDNVNAMRNPSNSHHLKIKGYRAAMQRLGLHDEALLLDSNSTPGETRRYVAARGDLFETVTAVLACNDRVAVEVISGLADLGRRVPEDCSVIGFDDTPFARAMRPALTTFQPRYAEVGTKAVEMLLDLIEGRKVQAVTVVPELVERESARAIGEDRGENRGKRTSRGLGGDGVSGTSGGGRTSRLSPESQTVADDAT